MDVRGTLKSVVTAVKKQKKRKSRDGDGADGSEGRRNIVSTTRGTNMIDAYAKLQRDGEKNQADVSAAKKKTAAKELKECEAAVAAFTAFVANCTAAGMEEDGVTWRKPYFNTDRLDATRFGSGNLYSDNDLKAILRLLFPTSGKLSKPRPDKIAHIRDPANFDKPWTKTSIDAELELKRHKLAELQAASEDVAEQDEAEDEGGNEAEMIGNEAEMDVAEESNSEEMNETQPQQEGL